MFFRIWIFDPNWLFCKGDSDFQNPMADFQNGLIARIFGVFSSGFMHRTTLMWLKNRFSLFFLILIFDPNWLFCKGYNLCAMADFQNRLISRIFGVFSGRFLHRTIVMWLKNRFSHDFWILIFDPNWLFCKDDADFPNCLISRIFGVSSCGVLHRTTLIWL